MSPQLSGTLTALPTPFTPSGNIDVDALGRVVDRNIDGGVDGLVACGSTGEFAAMSEQERRLVVQTAVERASGRVPVVAQTGAVNTAEAVRLSQHAQDCGASVVMLVTPYYEPLTEAETEQYLRTVAESVDIPVMLYNLPGATGVDLPPETVGRLAREISNVQYIKDTNADMSRVRQLVHHYGDVITTFGGWDTLILATLTEGAAGVVAGSANVVPGELVSIHRALRAGELDRARTEWSRLYPLMDSLMSVPFIPAAKAILNSLGLPVGSPRSPLLDLEPDTARRVSHQAAEALGQAGSVVSAGRASSSAVRASSSAQPLCAAQELPPSRHFVNGDYVSSTTNRVLEVVDPCSEKVLCHSSDGSGEDVDRAVAAAVAARDAWARRGPKDRSDALHAIADRVKAHADQLARLESANTGKPLAVAQDDIAGTIDTFRFFADADLAAAASTLRTASFWNSGQECGAACRVLVHESVAENFVENLVREAETLVAGEPTADDVEIGPVVSKEHFDRVRGHLERAQQRGAKAALGGGALNGTGYFVAPTVLVDVPEDAEITREEVFGPVVTVETFRNEDEAIRRANDTPTGCRPRSGPRTRAVRTMFRPAWRPARSGCTRTSRWPTKSRGAGSRDPDTAATCPSTRWTTTRAPSTSCTTTGADTAQRRQVGTRRGARTVIEPSRPRRTSCRAMLASPGRRA